MMMRKSLHVGTKTDVIKRRSKPVLDVEFLHVRISETYNECGQMIAAGVNPYAAVVAMDTKLSRIVTFNHPNLLNM
ncbi:hypothetical protein B2_gp66 [Shigella phage B2]|nr:hypothetical protein B2_gp66 [Shigella phage B2]